MFENAEWSLELRYYLKKQSGEELLAKQDVVLWEKGMYLLHVNQLCGNRK